MTEFQKLVRLVDAGQIGNSKANINGLLCWPLSLCLTGQLDPAKQQDNGPFRRHGDSVNTVRWNTEGTFLISGGDNLHLSIWSSQSHKLAAHFATPHANNIFDAKFVPHTSDTQIVSCAADSRVILLDLNTSCNHISEADTSRGVFTELHSFDDMAVKFQYLPLDPNSLIVTSQCGEAALIDIRTPLSAQTIFSDNGHCYGICFDPFSPTQFALTTRSPAVPIFDLRTASSNRSFSTSNGYVTKYCHPALMPEANQSGYNARSPTDVEFGSNRELLVNYSSYDLALFDTSDISSEFSCSVIQQYSGRANRNTFIKEARFFAGDRFIMTGSDTGELCVWEKSTAKLIRKIRADTHILNSIAVNPSFPQVACSGIDASVKMFDCELAPNLNPEIELNFNGSMYIQDASTMKTTREAVESNSIANELRAMGNSEYRMKNYETAKLRYLEALEALDYLPPGLKYHKDQRDSRKLVHLNLAAVRLNLKDWKGVVKDCSIVLSTEAKNVKALYRRAKAYFNLRYYRECQRDVRLALSIVPNDSQLRELYEQVQHKDKEKGNRNMFEGIFL